MNTDPKKCQQKNGLITWGSNYNQHLSRKKHHTRLKFSESLLAEKVRIGAENAGGAPNLSVSRRLAMSKACNFSYALIVITGLSARLDDTQGPGVNLGQVPREEGLSVPRNTFSSRAAPAAINGSQLDFQFFAGQHLSDGKERGRAFEDMLRRLLFTRARNRNPDHYSALRTFPAVFGY